MVAREQGRDRDIAKEYKKTFGGLKEMFVIFIMVTNSYMYT